MPRTTPRKKIPPDTITVTATKDAQKAVQDYLDRLTGLLVRQGGDFSYREARNAAEELRYTWVHDTNNAMTKDFQDALDQLKKEQQDQLKPLVDKAVKAGAVLPKSFSLAALFNTTWDAGTWKAITASRAQWHSLSESLWNIAGDAQRQALSLIEQASREGIPFKKIQEQLSSLLTEQGRGNMDYNLRRLWATELRRNRMVAQQYTWGQMGFIQQIRLARSADADITCPICGEAIGWAPLDYRIVPIDHGDMPPYHPWCKCTAVPVEPSAADVKKWLDDKYGQNPVAPGMNPIIVTPPVAAAQAAHVPTQQEIDQAFQDAHMEDNLRTFQDELDKMVGELSHKQGWDDMDVQEFLTRMHSLDPVVSKFGTPTWTFASAQPGKPAGYFTFFKQQITIDPSHYRSPMAMYDTCLHEYGHYLQTVLADYSTVTPSWLPAGDLAKYRQAIDDAIGALHSYSCRTIEDMTAQTKVWHIGVQQQYTKNALRPQGQQLKAAFDQLDVGVIGSDPGQPGFEFFSGLRDLGGEAFKTHPIAFGNGNYVLYTPGHSDTYWNRTDYLSFGNVKRAGVTEQEALNELTTGYLMGTLKQRSTIDSIMYKNAPELWRGVHRWIDIFVGH
jgi:hypothetical protein